MTSPNGTPESSTAGTNGAAKATARAAPAARRNGRGRIDIGEVMRDRPELITAALERATQDARQESRMTGIPLVFWRDGRCVWEDADGVEVPEPDWAKRFRETGEKPPVLFRRAV